MLLYINLFHHKQVSIFAYICLFVLIFFTNQLYAEDLNNTYITNTNNVANSILDVLDTTPRNHDRVWVKGSVVVGDQAASSNMIENTSNYSIFQAGIYLLELENEDRNKKFIVTISGGTTLGVLDNVVNNQNYIGYDAALQEQFLINEYFFTFAQIYLTENYKDDLFTGADATYNEMFYNNRFGRHFNYKYAVFTPEVFYSIGNIYNDSTSDEFLNQEYGVRATLGMKGKFAPYVFFEDSQNSQEIYFTDQNNNIVTWALGLNYKGKKIIFNINYSYERYTDDSYSEGQLYAGIRYNI